MNQIPMEGSVMLLEQFNEGVSLEISDMLRTCLDIPRWIDEIVTSRPFINLETLFDFADKATKPYTNQEINIALGHHLRIGENSYSTKAALSMHEQASLSLDNDRTLSLLIKGNKDYEKKFGRIFLIRVTGRNITEILDLLNQRLQNDPLKENLIVAQELNEIAVLRLKGVLTS